MTHLTRRVRNLENRHGRDASGLIPHTPEWMDWWVRRVRALWAKGENMPDGEKMPFEVARRLLQTGEEYHLPGDSSQTPAWWQR